MEANYFAVIPANVRYDKNIPSGAKLLYGEITALANSKGYCWASNNYFAELYGVTKATVRRWISALSDSGYIISKVAYKDGSKEISERQIFIANNYFGNLPPSVQKCDGGGYKNDTTPYQKCSGGGIKNDLHNNTMNNTIKNINEYKQVEEYAAILKDFCLSDKITAAYLEFIKMRNFIKAPVTDAALKLIIKKALELSNGDEESHIKIIEQSIEHNWKSVYPLKSNKTSFQNYKSRGYDYDMLEKLEQDMLNGYLSDCEVVVE